MCINDRQDMEDDYAMAGRLNPIVIPCVRFLYCTFFVRRFFVFANLTVELIIVRICMHVRIFYDGLFLLRII